MKEQYVTQVTVEGKGDTKAKAFADALSDELSSRVMINLYLSSPGVAGFPRHYDTHDFFILQIAGYKCPKSVDFRNESLPLSGAGKVLKRELREPYWEGFTKGVN